LVERLDPEMFNHTVGKSNAIFGLAYGNIAWIYSMHHFV
jgi:hypothetical protein